MDFESRIQYVVGQWAAMSYYYDRSKYGSEYNLFQLSTDMTKAIIERNE